MSYDSWYADDSDLYDTTEVRTDIRVYCVNEPCPDFDLTIDVQAWVLVNRRGQGEYNYTCPKCSVSHAFEFELEPADDPIDDWER